MILSKLLAYPFYLIAHSLLHVIFAVADLS